MSFLDFFRRRRRSSDDDAAARLRERLLRSGRIADARIFDVRAGESGAVTEVFYAYSVGGVDYESSQAMSEEQQARSTDYTPGSSVTVRYDPHHPGNSVVV